MASLADMLVGSALESSKAPAQVGTGSLQAGMQLAQHMDNVKQQRAELEQRKQQHELAKFEKVGSWIETAAKMPDGSAKKAFVNDFIPKGIQALGVSDKIDPTVLKMMQGDPNLGSFLKQQISEGKTNMGILASPEGVAQLAASPQYQQFGGLEAIKNTVEDYRTGLEETQEKRTQQEATKENARIGAQVSAGRQGAGQSFAAGQADKANAEALARKYVELGIPNLTTTLKKIDSKVIPGGFDNYKGGQIEGIGGKDSLIPVGRLSPAGRANRQLLQDAANDYIKMLTGAGVGVEEAVRLMNTLGIDAAIGEGGGVKVLFKGTKSSQDMVNGLKNLRDKMNETELTLKAGAGLGATRLFEENKKALAAEAKKSSGGKSFKDFPKDRQAVLIKAYMKQSGKTEAEARKYLEAK